jgi:hypothetical protein
LLGVYSGRLDAASDLGRCVTSTAIREVIETLPEATYVDPSPDAVEADDAVHE